jgi:thioredoxin 1
MNTTLLIISIVIGLFIFISYIAKLRMKKIPMVADHEKILVLSDTNFQHQTKNKIVLVDFWASWCAPCRMMAPVLNDVADELSGNIHIGKVNIEQYQTLAGKFKIRSIPTLVLLKNGVEVSRFSGVKSKDFLLQQIQKVK